MSQAYSTSALRKSAFNLISGKLLSAALTFTILLVLVRILPVDEYAAYVTFLASVELGYAISQVGLPWLAARYLPEYRIKATAQQTSAFCIRILLWQLLSLLFFSLLFLLALTPYLSWLNLEHFRLSALIFLGILIAEGVSRSIREALLEPLLQHGAVRSVMVSRQTIFLLGLILLYFAWVPSLSLVVMIELTAAGAGAFIGFYKLMLTFRRESFQKESDTISETRFSRQWKIGLHMYWAYLLSLTYSPQVLTNILQRVLGSDATALFGFLRTLNDQVVRYLPATMMFSIIRPKLVATSVTSDSEMQLNTMANLVGKINLLPLFPIILIVFLFGDSLVLLLSGGKFENSGLLLFGFLCLLIPFSQRLLIETVALTYGKSHFCKSAAMVGMLVLPVLWFLLQSGVGIWSPIIANGIAYVAFNTFVLLGLSFYTGFAFDSLGYAKLLIAFFISLVLAYIFKYIFQLHSLWSLGVSLVLSFFCYAALLLILNVISKEEWRRIKTLAKKA